MKVLETHYFLGTVLDGASRAILAFCLLAQMLEADVESLVQRARKLSPGERPRLISDNEPQYVAEDLAKFIRMVGMTHVVRLALLPAVQRQAIAQRHRLCDTVGFPRKESRKEIHEIRDQRLEQARERRRLKRQAVPSKERRNAA